MANSKKGRKIVIFSLAGVVLAGLTAGALLRKREAVITIQTEKVIHRNLTETVTANGKIQPVLQVKISPEVSGEIIDLPLKEGECVQKGTLILKIKPDFYIAQRNQSEASYKSSQAGEDTAEANLRKAEAEYKRNQDLFQSKLISDSTFDEVKAAYDVAKAQFTNSEHQVEMARAYLARDEDSLAKTTIVSPINGTISKLDSRVGERVVGTATMAGTEVMTISDLNEMEARVDIGETDVILIKPGQHARLEVDSFKDRKFNGTVTEIANSSTTSGLLSQSSGSSTSQEATKFQVKIRIQEKESFRPGMSVTAEIETRTRTNVISVPIASVTTRLPKEKKDKDKKAARRVVANKSGTTTNSTSASTNATVDAAIDPPGDTANTNTAKADKKPPKPIEVVFIKDGERAKMVPVKIGISDENYWEITDGLQEGQDVVSGGYRAIMRDLEDGKKVRIGPPPGEKDKDKDKDKDEDKASN